MRIRWTKMRCHMRCTMMTRMVMMTQTVVRSCSYIRVQIIHSPWTAPVTARTGSKKWSTGCSRRQWSSSCRMHKWIEVMGVMAVVLRSTQATRANSNSPSWAMMVMVVVMVPATHCCTWVHAKEICRLVGALVHRGVCWCRLGRLSKSLDGRGKNEGFWCLDLSNKKINESFLSCWPMTAVQWWELL